MNDNQLAQKIAARNLSIKCGEGLGSDLCPKVITTKAPMSKACRSVKRTAPRACVLKWERKSNENDR